MEFKFLANESRINDFIEFPNLIFAYDELMASDDDIMKYIDKREYIAFVRKGEELLAPYQKEIEQFYAKGSWTYPFAFLIIRSNPVFGIEDEEAYLNLLAKLDEDRIKQGIYLSLVRLSELESNEKNEELTKSPDVVNLIKDLNIDDSIKWNLFLIIENPKVYLTKYIALMRKLLPIYRSVYDAYQETIINYGKQLEEYINTAREDGLKQKTYGLITSNIFTNEINYFLISIIHTYIISIVSNEENESPYLILGQSIEKAFKATEEHNENKLNTRIAILKSLGDKTRYQVIKQIASGEFSTKKIATALEVSSATISYHLSALCTSKILILDKTNGKINYLLNWELLDSIFQELKEDFK